MNDNTIIKSILVLPYSKNICLYFINNGKRHAITYEKMTELLVDILPELAIKIHEHIIRKVSFYIDVSKKELYEVESNKLLIEKKEKIMPIIKEDTKPKYNKALSELVNKILRSNK